MYVVPLEVMSSASIFAIYTMFIEHHIASPEKVFHICVFIKLSKHFSNYAQNWWTQGNSFGQLIYFI